METKKKRNGFEPQERVLRSERGTGVRSYLANAGLDQSKIGWDQKNGAVTYGGRYLLTPEAVEDGVSYAGEDALSKAVISAYAMDGRPLVSVTDYAAGKTGVKNSVSWRDGYASIGGQLVKPATVINGKAMAEPSVVDDALARYREDAGFLTPGQLYDRWEEKYGGQIQSALDDILNREEWSYDPYEDEAFLAYRDAYTREGGRAFRDAYANMAANTGGYGNSAAMTAGNQQMNYYMQQLGDRIPELMEQDYDRYQQEQQRLFDTLESILETAGADYDWMSEANNQTIKNLSEANQAAYERDKDAYDRADRQRQEEFERQQKLAENQREQEKWAYQSAMYDQQLYRDQLDSQYYEDSLRERQAEKARENAQSRGWYTREEAQILGLSPDENGNYPSPYVGQLTYQKELWEQVEKPKAEFQAYLNRLLAMVR